MRYSAVIFVVVYVCTAAAYSAAGFQFTIPWFALVQTLLVSLPLAHGIAVGGHLLERLGGGRRGVRLAGLILGAVMLAVSRASGTGFAVFVIASGSLLLVRLLTDWRFAETVTLACFSVVLLLGSVQHLNYLALAAAGGRLHDEALMVLETWLFGLDGRSGMYPLVRDPLGIYLLESAYLTLAMQPLLVAMILANRIEALRRFLLSALTCYGVATVIFLILPAVGPTLYFDDSLDWEAAGVITRQTVESMRADFESVRHGGQPVTGFGYFIALPSLHAAVAVLCQLALPVSGVHFWFMLPVNALLLVSTVALGQHYAVDTVAGVALGAVTWAVLMRGPDPATGPRAD